LLFANSAAAVVAFALCRLPSGAVTLQREKPVCPLIGIAAAEKNDYSEMLVFSLLCRTFSLQSLITCVPR
jgi:hypothetical protein